MKKNLFQFNLSANIKWLCCSTAGRAKKEMAKTEKQEATILPGKEEEKNIQTVSTFSLAGAKCRNQTIFFLLNQILSAQVFSRKSFKTLGKILFLIACPSTRNCVSISNCSHSNLENVSFISRETSSFQDSMIPDFLMSFIVILYTMFWAYEIQLHPLAVNKRERKKWFW